ncbi:MAG TPA: hypothetical protein VGG40_04470 [Solirubrobacterales bacterium]
MKGFPLRYPRLRTPLLLGLASLAPLLLCLGVARASAATATPTVPAPTVPPAVTRIVHAPGRLVAIPASIPHEAGDMVDSRIVPDLRWISQRWPIYITDGYSGPLPDGEHVGCDECHVHGSDHYNGVAVDLVPVEPSSTCDSHWTAITALALWAEPVQNEPVLPFRWVGYEGDAGHGCGNHLHLSWNHAPAKQFELAEWVEVFPVGPASAEPAPSQSPAKKKRKRAPKQPAGPAGGVEQDHSGGLSPHGSGSSNGGGYHD